ncbi:MAG: hypothetical protein WDZ35_12135 [Crocinitomicaceae bacterium]
MVDYGEKNISPEQQEIYLWDGNGLDYDLPVSAGVYFYEIIVRTPAFVTQSYSGSLTVVGR